LKFSVIGHKKVAVSFAHYLNKNGFDLVAFYCDDIEKCVDCAIETGCKAYTDFEDVINDSELIVLSLDDFSLKNTMRTIALMDVKNKIFLTLGYSQSTDLMNVGNNNTYFSVFIPKVIRSDGITDLSDVTLFIEGVGKDYWDFYDELYIHNIKFEFIDKTKKLVYNISSKLVSDIIFTFCNFAQDILNDVELDIKNIESFAQNSVLEVFKHSQSIEKSDFGNITDNLNLIDANLAKKVEAIYKVLDIMSKRDKNNGKKY